MKNENQNTILRNKNTRIVNLFKYLVLIFVFLFIGVIGRQEGVKGADKIYSSTNDDTKIEVVITDTAWFESVESTTAILSYFDEYGKKHEFTKDLGSANRNQQVGISLQKNGTVQVIAGTSWSVKGNVFTYFGLTQGEKERFRHEGGLLSVTSAAGIFDDGPFSLSVSSYYFKLGDEELTVEDSEKGYFTVAYKNVVCNSIKMTWHKVNSSTSVSLESKGTRYYYSYGSCMSGANTYSIIYPPADKDGNTATYRLEAVMQTNHGEFKAHDDVYLDREAPTIYVSLTKGERYYYNYEKSHNFSLSVRDYATDTDKVPTVNAEEEGIDGVGVGVKSVSYYFLDKTTEEKVGEESIEVDLTSSKVSGKKYISGYSITTPEGVSGVLILVVEAEDEAGNKVTYETSVYPHVDNVSPTLTIDDSNLIDTSGNVLKSNPYVKITMEEETQFLNSFYIKWIVKEYRAGTPTETSLSVSKACTSSLKTSCYSIQSGALLEKKLVLKVYLPEKVYLGVSLNVKVYDKSANVAEQSRYYASIDNVAPSVEIVEAPASDAIAKKHTFKYVIKDENSTQVFYYICKSKTYDPANDTSGKITDYKTISHLDTATESNANSIELSPIGNEYGQYYIGFQVYDITTATSGIVFLDDVVTFDKEGWTLSVKDKKIIDVDGETEISASVSGGAFFGPGQELVFDVNLNDVKWGEQSSYSTIDAQDVILITKNYPSDQIECDIDYTYSFSSGPRYRFVVSNCSTDKEYDGEKFTVTVNFSDTNFLDYAGNGVKTAVSSFDIKWDNVSSSAVSLKDNDEYDVYTVPNIYMSGDRIYLYLNFDAIVRYYDGLNVAVVELLATNGKNISIVLDDITDDRMTVFGSDEIDSSMMGRISVNSIDVGSLVDKAGNEVEFSSTDFIGDTQMYANIEKPKITEAKIETYLVDSNKKFSEIDMYGEGTLFISHNLKLKVILKVQSFVPVGTETERAESYAYLDTAKVLMSEEKLYVVTGSLKATKVEGWIATYEVVLDIQLGKENYTKIVLNEGLLTEYTDSDYGIKCWRQQSAIKLGTSTLEKALETNDTNPGNIFTSNAFDGVKNMKKALLMYNSPSNGFYIAGESVFYETEDYCDLIDKSSLASCAVSTNVSGIEVVLSDKVDKAQITITEVYNKYGVKYEDTNKNLTISFYDPKIDVEIVGNPQMYLEKVDDTKWNLYVEEDYIDNNGVKKLELKVKLNGGTIGCISEGIGKQTCTNYNRNITEYDSAIAYDDLNNLSTNVNYVIKTNDRLTTINITVSVYRYDSSEISYELEEIYVTENFKRYQVTSFSNGVSLGGLYGNTIEMVYSINDGNSFKPDFKFKDSVEAYNISLVSKPNNAKFVGSPNISATVSIDANNKIKLTFELDDVWYGLIYKDEIGIYNTENETDGKNNKIVSPTGVYAKQLEDELTVINTSTVYLPCLDETCDAYAVISGATKAFEYDIVYLQPAESVYFEKFINGEQQDVPISVTPANEEGTDDSGLSGYFDFETTTTSNSSQKTRFNWSFEQDEFPPIITEIVSCDEVGEEPLVVTKGNGFCFKVTIKDNWQYGLNIDGAEYVDVDNNLKITFAGISSITMNEHSEADYNYINTFDFVLMYDLNNPTAKGNTVTINSATILDEILKYNEGIIYDMSKQDALLEASLPDFDIMFVPEGLEITNAVVLRDEVYGTSGLKQYYNVAIPILLSFNREIMGPEEITAEMIYGDTRGGCILQPGNKEFMCILPNESKFDSLTFSADKLVDANGLEYGITKQWSASELFDYDFVVIDQTKPVIEFSGDTSVNYFNDSDEITLTFSVDDLYLDDSVGAYPTIKVGETACSEVSKKIENGVVTVVVKCNATGNISYSFAAGSFSDLAGNKSDSVSEELTNYLVSIDEFKCEEKQFDLVAIAADTSKSSENRVITFNEIIESFNEELITVNGGVGAVVEVAKSAPNALTLTVTAENLENSKNGLVVVNFAAGAVTDIYGNSTKEFNLDTNVNVVNGKFNIIDIIISTENCEEIDDKYYCNEGDSIIFVVESDRPIKGENTLTIKVNGIEYELINAEASTYESELAYMYTVENFGVDEVEIEFVSLDIENMRDEFGNVGVTVTELDLSEYIIDTLVPSFNSNTAKTIVNLGHRHSEYNICKNYYDSEDVYSCSVVVKNDSIDNYLNDTNEYYAKASDGLTLVLTIEDKAGNSNSKEITLVIDNSEVLSVIFSNKTSTYGDSYSYDSSTDISVVIPDSFVNIGVTEDDILDLLNPVLMNGDEVVTDYSLLNVGEYTITTSGDTEIVVNGVKFNFMVFEGTYTVLPKKISLSDYNFTVTKVYDGKKIIEEDNIIIKNKAGNVVTDDFDWGEAYFDSSEAGTQGYTIMYISHVSANYEVEGSTSKYGTGVIETKLISTDVIDNIVKDLDGTTSVQQSSYTYVDADIDNKEVVISWTSAEYVNSTCTFEDGSNSCDVEVILSGLKTDNKNYSINNSGKTIGRLELNDADYVVTLKDTNGNRITGDVYTNEENYTLSVASINYGSIEGNINTHTYKWCTSSSVLTENICSESTSNNDTYNASLEEGINYVYLVVTNASGKESFVETKIYKNTKFGATTISLETMTRPLSVTYYLGNTIEVVLTLNSKLRDETVLSNLHLNFESYSGVSYEFDYSRKSTASDYNGMPITNIYFTYTVVRNVGSQVETDLEYVSMSGFGGLVDIYGNEFDTKSNVTQEGPIINIDTSPGAISSVEFIVDDTESSYIKVNEEVKLDVYLMFTGVIKKASNMSPVNSVTINGKSSDQCEVIADEDDNETIIHCSYSSFSTDRTGDIVIESFGNVTVKFELADNLVLDASYISKLYAENKVASVYVDGEELELTFSPSSQVASGSAEVYVTFNKDTVNKNLSGIDYKTLFGINDDNVTISYSCDKRVENCKFVIEYAGSDSKLFTFSLVEDNAIEDYVGNVATGNTFTITFDNNELSVDSNNIQFNVSGNCIEDTCGNGSEIEVVVPFSRKIVNVTSATLYYEFGVTAGNIGYSSIDASGNIVFVVPIASQNGEFALTNISYTVVDDLGRDKTADNVSLEKPSGIYADTLGPSQPSVSVDTVCENTVCKNGDKVKFTVTLDEVVTKYSFEVVTNFGSVSVSNITPVSLRSSITIEMTINGSGDGNLDISSIAGTFVDRFDNESSYDEEITINSYSIVIDNTAPVTSSVNLNGTAYNQQSEAEIITVTKGQNEMFDASKVCLKNVDTGAVVCANGTKNPIEFNDGQITVKFATLNGSYQIVLLEGFIYDLANNMSAYNDESRAFAVSSDRDNIVVEDITVSNGKTQTTSDNGTYYYVDGNSVITFNIYAKSTSGSTQFSGDACDKIKFYKVNTDYEEVEGLFDCSKTASKNVKISVNNSVNLEDYVDHMYFFVIDGTIMSNTFGNTSNSFVGEGIISLVVTPALEEKSEYRVFSTNNVVASFDEDENAYVYYIKKSRSLDITFKFNNPIKKYELNNSSNTVDGKYDVKIRGFKEGILYDVVFYDYLDHEVELKIKVYEDNTAPVISVSHNHVGNYIANKAIKLSFECVDVVDNYDYDEVVGSGVDCSTRAFKVYKNGELLDKNTYSIESIGDNTSITLNNDSITGDIIKVDYTIQDSLKNTGTGTISFTVDREVPVVSATINKSPVKSSELVATIKIQEKGSGLKNNVLNYKWVNGEIEVTGSANIVDGKATIYGNDITVDGQYTLVILPISDNVDGASDEYNHPTKVIVDNTAASINGNAITSIDTAKDSSCKVVENIKYCKGESNFIATVTFNEDVVDVIASAEGFTTQVSINNNVATIIMYVDANASNRNSVQLNVVTTDVAGNVNSSALAVILSDVVVDTTNDFSDFVVTLDNSVKNNPTKITGIEVSHDNSYAGIQSITYEVVGDAIYSALSDVKEIEFKSSTDVVIIVEDYAGNIGKKTYTVEVDNVAPKFDVAFKDGSYVLRSYTYAETIDVVITSDDSDIVSYCVGISECVPNDEWLNREAKVTLLPGNNTVYVYVKDASSNVSYITRYITFMDINVINNNGDVSYSNGYNITISGVDTGYNIKLGYGVLLEDDTIFDSIYTKKIVSLTETTVNLKETLTGVNGIYKVAMKVYVDDKSGYSKILLVNNLHIDTKLEFIGDPIYSNDWTNSSIPVRLYVTEDEISELTAELLKLNSNNKFVKVNDCIIDNEDKAITCYASENGTYRIKVKDTAGNEKEPKLIYIEGIDKVGQTGSLEVIGNGNVYNKYHDVVVRYNGSGAPVSKAMYLLFDELVTVETFETVYNENAASAVHGTLKTDVTSEQIRLSNVTGQVTLYVYVVDQAGNKVLTSKDICLDNTAPVITFKEFDGNYTQVKDPKDLVDVVDANVGMGDNPVIEYEYVQYDDQGNAIIYSNLSELEGAYFVRVTAVDSLGNASVAESEVVAKIDNIAPKIEKINIAVNAEPEYRVTDLGSRIATIKYCYGISTDGCTYTNIDNVHGNDIDIFTINMPETSASFALKIVAIDIAGNEYVYDGNIVYDNKAPTIGYTLYNGLDNEFATSDYSEENNVITFSKYTNKDILIDLNITDEITESDKICSYVVYASDSIVGKEGSYNCDQTGIEYEGVTRYNVNMRNGMYEVSADMVGAYGGIIYVTVFAIDEAGISAFKVFVIDTVSNKKISYKLTNEVTVAAQETSIKVSDFSVLMSELVSVKYKKIAYDSSLEFIPLQEIYNSIDEEGNIVRVDTEDNEYRLNVLENSLYVFEVVDKWGNSTYTKINITNIDDESPDSVDITLKVENGELFENNNGYINENKQSNILVGSNRSFIYNGKLYIELDALTDSGIASVYFKLCYATECRLIELSRETYNIISIEPEYSGTITYSVEDSAGNSNNIPTSFDVKYYGNNSLIEKEYSFEVGVNTAQIDVNKKYNNLSVDYSILDNTKRYKAINFYLVKEGNEDIVENRICDSGWLEQFNGSYSLTCSGKELDGYYVLKYKVQDILGNENDSKVVIQVYLDNVKPINSSSDMSFKLVSETVESETYYKLRYFINKENLLDIAAIKILYDNNDVYCTISNFAIKVDDCGTLASSRFDENNQLKFKTVVIDTAGNVSDEINYSIEYDNSRKMNATLDYDPITKTMKIKVLVDNAYGNVTKVLVSFVNSENKTLLNEYNLLDDVNNVDVTNKMYHLYVSESSHGSLFVNHIIDGTFTVKVYDSYDVVVDSTEIGRESLKVYYDVSDISVTHKSTTSTIVSTLTDSTRVYVVSNKELLDVKYILRKLSDENTGTITVGTFENVYNSCWKDEYCVNGELTRNGEGLEYSYVILSNDKSGKNLVSAEYELTIYAMDKYEHKIVDSGKIIYIDNTKATIKEIDENGAIIKPAFEETIVENEEELSVKVYDRVVNLSISDTSGLYNSGIRSIEIFKDNSTRSIYTFDTDNIGKLEIDDIKLGAGSYGEGYYKIVVTDLVGNQTVEYVLVDANNDGIAIFLGDVLTNQTTFNLQALTSFNFVLNEDMRMIKLEMFTPNTIMHSIQMNSDNTAKVCSRNGKVYSCRDVIGHNLNMEMNSQLSMLQLLTLAGVSVNGLSKDINKMAITIHNRSAYEGSVNEIKHEFILDFIDPTITVNNGIKYNNNKITTYKGSDCTGSCYALKVAVMTSQTEDEVAQALQTIIQSFINKVDGNAYSSVKDKLEISINGDAPFKASLIDWSDYNILHETGVYLVSIVYTEDSQNKSAPVTLRIDVKDEIAPEITLNDNSNKVDKYIETDDGITYTDLGAIGTDNYGFDEKGKVRTTDVYSLTINGVVVSLTEDYEVLAGVYKVGNVYKFNSKGYYEFVYTIVDYARYSISKKIVVEVFDNKAPNMSDPNKYLINKLNGNRYFAIEGVEYVINESQGVIYDVSGIEVVDSVFMLNGKEYTIYDTYVMLSGININSSMICFENVKGCENRLQEITARDVQDNQDKEVSILEILHSKDGIIYGTASYTVSSKDGLFRISSIKFDKIGYYKVVFRAVDIAKNENTIEYIIRVFDIDKPAFTVDNTDYNDGGTHTITKQLDSIFDEVSNLGGVTLKDKIGSWVTNWMLNSENVKYKDNYEIDKSSFDVGKVELLESNLEEKEFARYQVTLTVKDTSGNASNMVVTVIVKDNEKPVNGEITFSYNSNMDPTFELNEGEICVNEKELYFTLSNGSDKSNEFHYEYIVEINGELQNNGEWSRYEGSYVPAYIGANTTDVVRVIYKVVDDLGNESSVESSGTIMFDNTKPNIIVSAIGIQDGQEVLLEYLQNGTVYSKEGFIKVSVTEDQHNISIKKYHNNTLVMDTNITIASNSEYSDGLFKFGHYRYVITDGAGNESSIEFIKKPQSNEYVVMDRNSIGSPENAATEQIKFDRVVLQKLASYDENMFYFEEMDTINNNDAIYLLGVVKNASGDKEGALFSIYANPVKGELFKEHIDYFPLNTVSNITGLFGEGYAVNPYDYLINMGGEKYILVGILADGYVEEIPDEPQEDSSGGGSSASGANMSWVLYVLGGIGVIGGGFLITRLKRRIRAA